MALGPVELLHPLKNNSEEAAANTAAATPTCTRLLRIFPARIFSPYKCKECDRTKLSETIP